MREIFEEIFINQPLDPMESARRNTRPNLRKRFYKEASVGAEGEGGFPGVARRQAGAHAGAALARGADARAGAGAGRANGTRKPRPSIRRACR